MFQLIFFIHGCQESLTKPPSTKTALCNLVESEHCLLPFPSQHLLRADDSSRTGYRLNLQQNALPVNVDGVPFSPVSWNDLDGFSLGSSAYAALPEATLSGTVQWPDLEDAFRQDTKTIFLELETSRWIPHTVERESNAIDYGQDLLMLRPMIPLKPNQTYVIGIRHLVDSNGFQIDPPEGFEQLREGEGVIEELDSQKLHYETVIFPALEAEGFQRNSLQLAWSFHTRSDDILQPIQHMKVDVLEYSEEPIPYQIEEARSDTCATDSRGSLIEGQFEVPLYLDSWEPGSLLWRDDNGLPQRNGKVQVGFHMLIGCSVLHGEQKGTLVQYGHGLLGKRSEIDSDYLHNLADEHGLILFAADWTGMKLEDSSAITLNIVEDASRFQTVPDRLHQGWMEFFALSLLVRQPHFMMDPHLTLNDDSMINPERLFFYGNSQGAVLGGGYSAMHGQMDGVILGVGGAPFSLLLNRAQGFTPFLLILETMYDDWRDITLIQALYQQLWDPTESIGWTHLQQSPVLMQAAIGDGSVPTIGAHVLARGLDAKLMQPATRNVFGLDSVHSPYVGSVYVEWDYGIPDSDGPYPAPNDTDFDPHNGPRTSEMGKAQIGHFIRTGAVSHFCDGPCDWE